MAAMIEIIQTLQYPSDASFSPLYAEVAYTPLKSWPSNVHTLIPGGITPSTMTDTVLHN